MSSNSGLSPPGSSTYASGTMYVGDGTWDSSRNTFLLPNLMGLNFETMQYNGMGNRFLEMAGYHSLILAHGVIATIIFLGLVPASVLIIRYYPLWNPYWAVKYHIWLQVLTLFLTTVVFVLGWFAVGPQRSLTNPHHGIGLAIYVLVIFQILWGWLSRRANQDKRRYSPSLRVVIHRWLGRALALLGIAQIPLGLTLYGSPKSLFILFAVGAFAWLFLFFVLSYRYDESGRYYESDYDSRGSYASGPSVVDDRRHSSLGRTAAALAAGAGLTQLFRRRSSGHAESEAQGSYVDEKYPEDRQKSGWGKRLLEIGAVAGAAALAKSIFDRRRDRERDTESGRYRPAHARSDSMTEDSLSRVEEGRVASGPQGPYMHPGRRPSHGSMHSSYYTQTEEEQDHGVRNAILGAGAFAAVRNLFRRGKENSEQQRVEDIRRQDIEEERLARASSKKKYTGDGFVPRRQRPSNSVISSDVTTDITPRPQRPGEHMVSGAIPVDVPPVPPTHRHTSGSVTATDLEAAAAGAAVGAAAGSSSRRRRSSSSRRRRDDVASPPVSVKVKMHNDGRHVTLRRLTEEEAAEAKRRERDRRGSSRRRGSASSLSGNEGGAGSDRWRRVEEMERRQAEQLQEDQAAASAAAAGAAAAIPPPPPGPPPPSASHAAPSNVSMPPVPQPNIPYGASSITSPGGTYTGTEASADYANNRRRRRAERSQARARQQQQHSVEFT